MLTRSNVGTVVLLLFSLGFCGCTTAQDTVSQTTPTPLTSTATAAGADSPLWKIPPRPAGESEQVAALEEINKIFRATYASERSRYQRAQRAVVLIRFSGATLFRDGKIVETARILPSEYFNLRYAAHVPFMLFLKLNPLCGSPMNAATRSELEQWKVTLKKSEGALDNAGFNPEQLRRQRRMLDDAIALLQETLTAGKTEADHLRRYIRAASVDIDQNMREAGAAQVEGIHRQLLQWRRQLPDAEWNQISFVVRGPQQPRGGNAATMYLSALLKDPGDGRGYEGESTRLVYREDTSLAPTNVPADPWEADLELLAAVQMDAVASEAIFSDPDRLAIDIVSDGARGKIRALDFSQLQIR